MKIRLDPLDKLFSDYIRMRVYSEGVVACEFCGREYRDKVKENGGIYPAWRYLQCSHFHGRRKRSVRYDPENACALDFSCHIYLGENPYAHTEFFKQRLGSERFELLNIRANKLEKIDKEAITVYLKEKIKEVNDD